MTILWTKHAEERQKEWERKCGITREMVEATIDNPQQLVSGDRDILIAQSKLKEGLLRIPFLQVGTSRKILTVYWTSKIAKYWKEEK